MRLTADRRNGVHNLDAEVPDADVNAALDWLSKLDGERHTLLSLERTDGRQLMVGGGPCCMDQSAGSHSLLPYDQMTRA